MKKKKTWLVGIDEAGRGPLAGPITLAIVVCPKGTQRFFRGIRDSKHLTLKAREEWFLEFKNHSSIFFHATSMGPALIDRDGLSFVIKKCIGRLLKRAEQHGVLFSEAQLLLDGGLKAPARYNQKTIIKGDERIPIIGAASIVAKVLRDRKMVRLAREFPDYGLEIHKGYGTELHRKRIKKCGISECHRKTFCKKLISVVY